jgi:hypothetical protein
MQDAVLRELTDALADGGPALAIRSCHVDAEAAMRRLALQPGVAAGRTSARLRNTANAPRPWSAPLVSAYSRERARNVDGFVVDLGASVGVMRPIAEQPMCAACHGPADRIAPAVRSALLERYPSDPATGFEDGDIRGWFWVEVPKRTHR